MWPEEETLQNTNSITSRVHPINHLCDILSLLLYGNVIALWHHNDLDIYKLAKVCKWNNLNFFGNGQMPKKRSDT